MALNKFFTIMVVPEKSSKVTKIVLPSYIFKGALLAIAFLAVLATIMVLDYANVMNQINENKQLKTENRQLRQNVQVFKNKVVTIENTLDRVKTFVTKLRIITNIEDTGPIAPSPMAPIAAPPPIPGIQPASVPPVLPQGITPENSLPAPDERGKPRRSTMAEPETDIVLSHASNHDSPDDISSLPPSAVHRFNDGYENARAKRSSLLAALMNSESESFTMTDIETSSFVKSEFEKLDAAYEEVTKFALSTEAETHDILEKLGEKIALLASTPTRMPTTGYITSDYGVRLSPYDGRHKMHEGIDIANRLGADVIAPADGTVTFASTKPGYGKVVIIDHGNGIETRYAHSLKLFVTLGDRVRRGQRIAAVGNSGHSTGPHCHYEVHVNGLPVDPCWYILDQTSNRCRQR